MKTLNTLKGVDLIRAERERQISQEGYLPEHDAEHVRGEIAFAAIAYALASANVSIGVSPHGIRGHIQQMHWPASWGEFKMADTQIRNLVKAGALIAAEIDRLATPLPETEGQP